MLRALHFAADRHRDQRRKDPEASPYINHPIQVAELLARVGRIDDVEVLQAAILHDTVEDTETTPEEIENLFGQRVRSIVEEVTDDKSLLKVERKKLQEEHAAHLSEDAKLVKLADKISNTHDVSRTPPTDWSHERRIEYLDWAERVVAGCRGVNEELEKFFDHTIRSGRKILAG